MMARKLLAFAILFWAVPALLQASTPRDPYQFFFEQSLGDLSEELEIAREEGKQGVFLFFEMDECPFCHRMKQTVLNQPEVQEYFKQHFHSLSIDVEGDIDIVDFEGSDTTQKEFARQNRVRATPLLAFAPSGVEEFIWMGEYIVDQVYLQKDDSGGKIRFTRYKKMKKNKTL
jgi:thioredoxin-related protein